MTDGTSDTSRRRHPWSSPHPGAACALTIATTVAGVLTAVGSAAAATAPTCAATAEALTAVTFVTEIQYGGGTAPWHPDKPLTILISNRQTVLGQGTLPTGTQISWSGPAGNATITLFDQGTFTGSAQFPGEGPVGYRGTAATPQPTGATPTCMPLTARFNTEIQYGGSTAPWHPDKPLTILISNRETILGPKTMPAGTSLAWSGPAGNATITLFEQKAFTGSAQFPGEGPVGYRGTPAPPEHRD